MPLRFLDFEVSEDADGHVTLDALATVSAAHWPALLAEVSAVLRWAERDFGGARGPLDEGGDWDCELQGTQDAVTPLAWDTDPSGAIAARPQGGATLRYSLSLTLSGKAAFADAWREQWDRS